MSLSSSLCLQSLFVRFLVFSMFDLNFAVDMYFCLFVCTLFNCFICYFGFWSLDSFSFVLLGFCRFGFGLNKASFLFSLTLHPVLICIWVHLQFSPLKRDVVAAAALGLGPGLGPFAVCSTSETFTQRRIRRIGAGSPHSNGSVNGADSHVFSIIYPCWSTLASWVAEETWRRHADKCKHWWTRAANSLLW